jgi:hypothetical protein
LILSVQVFVKAVLYIAFLLLVLSSASDGKPLETLDAVKTLKKAYSSPDQPDPELKSAQASSLTRLKSSKEVTSSHENLERTASDKSTQSRTTTADGDDDESSTLPDTSLGLESLCSPNMFKFSMASSPPTLDSGSTTSILRANCGKARQGMLRDMNNRHFVYPNQLCLPKEPFAAGK